MNKYIILLSICLHWGSDVWADTLRVGPGQRVKSIKEGIAASHSGDVLVIDYGHYREGRIIIDKPLTLVGIDYPRFDGEGKTEIFTITADDVTLQGLQIEHVGTSYTEDRAGIKLEYVKNVLIRDNRLYDCFFGIYLKESSNCQVLNNEVIGKAELEMSSGNAIHLWYCKNIQVKDNRVEHHRDGIYLEFADQSVISNNISAHNLRYGLHFMFSNQDVYTNNIFKANGAGVAVMFSKNIQMSNNSFEDNWGPASYGLLLKEIYDGDIKGNRFIKNTVGIYAESANRLMINDNDFKGNGWALKIMGSCMDNVFTGNNFQTNTFDLTTGGNTDHNTYVKNYWSEYNGYDLDRDGFGDVPHRPVQLFSYVVGKVDASIILLRSLFIDIINFAEKVTPVFIPEKLVDPQPLMKPRP